MAPRPRVYLAVGLLVVITILSVGVLPPKTAAQARLRVTKDTVPSDGIVDVGEMITITLTAKNLGDQPATVRLTDPNPDEAALKIDPNSITGGAIYVPSTSGNRERVEWTGNLDPGQSKTFTFEMEALDGGAGKTVTNRATIEDVNNPQTIPEDRDRAYITINPVGLPAPVLQPIENADQDGNYTLVWSSVAGASSYILEEADNASFADPSVVYQGTGTQHTVSGQLPGKWYYRVRAASGEDLSEWSNTEWTVVVPAPPELYPIANACNAPDYVVDWSDVTGAASYTLQVDDEDGFSNPKTNDGISESQYQVTDQPDGTWYYRVRAEGPDGSGSSDWSETQWTTVGGGLSCIARLPVMLWKWPPAPQAPTLRNIENGDGDGEFEVRWTSSATAESYLLEEAKDSNFRPVVNSYETMAASYDVKGRGASRLFYRVKARNFTGDSPWSNVEQVDVLRHLEGTGSNPEDQERQMNGFLISGLTYLGTIQSAQDVSDYFYVNLIGQRTIELWLSKIPSGHNWDLVLRDSGLNTYDGWYSIKSGNRDENVRVTVPGGRYYIQVYNDSSSGSSQPYNLKIEY